MPYSALTERRLQLLARGYLIIPNRGKIPAVPGWNTQDFVDRELKDNARGTAVQRVATWEKRHPEAQSTGLLVRDGGVVMDFDVNDAELVYDTLDALMEIAPEVHVSAPLRFGSGAKVALFMRLAEGEEDFVRIASPRFGGHCVEVFGGRRGKGGNTSRQFGIDGPHSYNDDGTVAVEYRWDTDTPALWEIDAVDLPTVTVKQVHALIDAFVALAEAAGLEREAAPAADASAVVYDITEETRFNTDRGGDLISYDELCDEVSAFGSVRCSSDFMPGRGESGRRDRCIASVTPRGIVGVHVFGDATTHYPAERAPRTDDVAEGLKALKDAQGQPEAPPSGRPADTAALLDKAAWLVEQYAYCALTYSVVELHKPDDDCHLAPKAFAMLYRAWREASTGPRGGQVFSYATAYWETTTARVDVEGVRMRPDQPFPVFSELGRKYKNTYVRPMHTGHGDIQPWLDFIAHLIPDPVERAWFCNWLAHKYLNPGIPGVAVVMVAADSEGPIYGAGRGMLRDILARLLGHKYVRPVDFDVFTGSSSQGVYTDWGAYAVLVTLNEARDTADSGRWSARRAVYERIKEIVDPRPIERSFTAKGKPAFRALAAASYLIATNHMDAFQIPPDDRRLTVLTNGGTLPPAQAAALQLWMDEPGNIAALAQWLGARSLTGFNVYETLDTPAKRMMQQLATNDVEDAFKAVRRRIGPQGLFTREVVLGAVLDELGAVENDAVNDARRLAERLLKKAAGKVNGYRMPRSVDGRRSWIQGWLRRPENPLVDGTAEQAAAAVRATAARLSGESRGPVDRTEPDQKE